MSTYWLPSGRSRLTQRASAEHPPRAASSLSVLRSHVPSPSSQDAICWDIGHF